MSDFQNKPGLRASTPGPRTGCVADGTAQCRLPPVARARGPVGSRSAMESGDAGVGHRGRCRASQTLSAVAWAEEALNDAVLAQEEAESLAMQAAAAAHAAQSSGFADVRLSAVSAMKATHAASQAAHASRVAATAGELATVISAVAAGAEKLEARKAEFVVAKQFLDDVKGRLLPLEDEPQLPQLRGEEEEHRDNHHELHRHRWKDHWQDERWQDRWRWQHERWQGERKDHRQDERKDHWQDELKDHLQDERKEHRQEEREDHWQDERKDHLQDELKEQAGRA